MTGDHQQTSNPLEEPTTIAESTNGQAPPEHIVIALQDIHKAFGAKKVLRGVSMEVERGTSVSVMGGSGAGKSVLIKHIVQLLKPDRGEVWVKGQRLDLALWCLKLDESRNISVRYHFTAPKKVGFCLYIG